MAGRALGRNACLALVVLAAGCSSAPPATESAFDDRVLDGYYERSGGGGDLAWLVFTSTGAYSARHTNTAAVERGTYSVDEASATLTLKPSAGPTASLPFAVTGLESATTKPASAPVLGGDSTLVEPGTELVTRARSLQVDGGEFRVVEGFCKAAGSVSPTSMNCGNGGSCGAGQVYCVRS